MKVGDLVIPTHNPRKSDGYMGVIVAYDEDDDPIVLWNKHDPEDYYDYTSWTGCCALPEYRSSIEVIQ